MAHLVYDGLLSSVIEKMKMEAFIDGIRDREVRRLTSIMPKDTYRETVAFVLAQESAVSTSALLSKTRNMGNLDEENLKSLVSGAVAEAMYAISGQKGTVKEDKQNLIKCFFCGALGHMKKIVVSIKLKNNL